MEKDFIDLFGLQTKLKEGIECLFPKRLWVKAEVSSVKSRPGGHCYLELSQSDDKGLIAKANAVVWSSKFRFLSPYFESVTGSPLDVGMTVLVEVQVVHSQLYGLSLVINDIDPEYSLGQKELQRQMTIDRLVQEGLMDLQKELALPLLPYDLAVISAEDAAGYRDFMMHLEANPYGFRFNVELFPALMQGAECPTSVISALDSIMDSGKHYDAVLILRGGGSRLDLSCFDDYGMCAVIAQYPLPVLTAIGHDQDYHIADMVANEYVKTPTALADLLIEIYENEDARLSSYSTRTKVAATGKIAYAESYLKMMLSKIKGSFAFKIAAMESEIKVLQTRITSADPKRVIERGYVLVLDSEGVVIKGVRGKKAGERLSMMFPDGKMECVIEKVSESGYEG